MKTVSKMMSLIALVPGMISLIAFVILPTITYLACTPAQTAEWQEVEQTVLTDFNAGKTAEQIEADVAKIVIPGNASADVVAILNDALSLLIDSGAIQDIALARAKAMQVALAARVQKK
jgi:hypothetical protein